MIWDLTSSNRSLLFCERNSKIWFSVWGIFLSKSSLLLISLLILSSSIFNLVILSRISSFFSFKSIIFLYFFSNSTIEALTLSSWFKLSKLYLLKSANFELRFDSSCFDSNIFLSRSSLFLISVLILSNSILRFVISFCIRALFSLTLSIPVYCFSNSSIDFMISSSWFLFWSLSEAELAELDATTNPSHLHRSPSFETSLWPYLSLEINFTPSSLFMIPVWSIRLFIALEPPT